MKKFLAKYGGSIGGIAGTMIGFEIAAIKRKDAFYYTILGGFVGTVIANLLIDVHNEDNGNYKNE